MNRARLLTASLLLLSCALLVGCQKSPPAPSTTTPANVVAAPPKTGAANPASGFPVTLTDLRGVNITLAAAPKRILSLTPSNTEILYAVGAGDAIAADTPSCNFPPEAAAKPHIDPLKLSLEAVTALHPDLIVAVGSLNMRAVVALQRTNISILVVDTGNFLQVYESIQLIGKATGHSAKAEEIVKAMQARLESIKATVAKSASRPKVLAMYGTKPIYTTMKGSFIDEAITIAGGQNVADANPISAERVVVLQPDVILFDPKQASQIKAIPGWLQSVPAVKNGRIFKAETLQLPGPRLPDAVESLARYLHPDLFPASKP